MTDAMYDLSVREIGRRLRNRSLTSEALTDTLLRRIEALDGKVHAFIRVTADRALEDARRADVELGEGRDRGPLHGVPYGLKDLFDVAGLPTTCGSKLRLDHVAAEDSEVARRLRAAGAVLLGKLTTHEFAQGGPSFDLPFPPARNPWNPDHFTSGSSSGSGAAIAARMLPFAMGSDTGGSIRSPAALCGTVGLKPTYGRISARGVFPLAYSLDHCGPLGRRVEDVALAMQVIAGHDPADPTSADQPVPDFVSGLGAGVTGLRIAWPRKFISSAKGGMPEVVAHVERIAASLVQAGALIEEVELPDYAIFVACGLVILGAESFEVHQQNMRTRPQDFGALMMQRTILGATISGSDYVRATRLRRHLCKEMNRLWGRYDAMLTASVLATAPRMEDARNTPWLASQAITFNVTGWPAMTVPVGLVGGLPAGVVIAGPAFAEPMVLRVGETVERLSGWSEVALPELAAGEATGRSSPAAPDRDQPRLVLPATVQASP